MINNLEGFAHSLAESIKRMSINDMTDKDWILREDIEASVRGSAYCSEMKPTKNTKQKV